MEGEVECVSIKHDEIREGAQWGACLLSKPKGPSLDPQHPHGARCCGATPTLEEGLTGRPV